MLDDKMSNNVESKLRNQLDGLWTVETESGNLVIRAEEMTVWARLEPLENESVLVSGYREYECDDANNISILDWHKQIPDIGTAANTVVERCNRWESEIDQQLSEDDLNIISVKAVTEMVHSSDAVFAAVTEDKLAHGLFELTYHTPAGGDKSDVHNALGEYDAVEIDGQPFPIQSAHVLHPEVHSHQRVPLYSKGIYGTDEVSVKEGINHIRDFVETDVSPTSAPTETVGIDNLVNQLVDAGATAISVVPEISNENRLTFKVWMEPSAGYETVGSYGTVEVNGQALELYWEFNCVDGPAITNKVEVYVSNDIIGAVPVPIGEGVSNLQEYVASGCPHTAINAQRGGKR